MLWKPPHEVLEASRIWVLCGNYGSGKTEISLNLALASAKKRPTMLVDLDIVNPYFRAAEQEALLVGAGVQLIKPVFALTTMDVPALPAQVLTAFEGEASVFFDVGGDDTGAAALGQYHLHMAKQQGHMLFVVNTYRPLTRDVGSLLDLAHRIMDRSRMDIYALVNNANLGVQSTGEEQTQGAAIVQEVAERLNVQHAFHAVDAHLLSDLPEAMRKTTLAITPYMRPEWL